MNDAIDSFVKKFEVQFSRYLVDPRTFEKNRKLESFPGSKFFKFKYSKKPDHSLSDWDLACWLNMELISIFEVQDMDRFIRCFNGFSHIGLFTQPDNYDHLQYMAYTPNQSFAPFLDLHLRLRGKLPAETFNVIYPGNELERQLWVILTAWRKLNKDGKERARQFFKTHNSSYWPNDDTDRFIDHPAVYFREKFPDETIPKTLLYKAST